MRTSRAYCAQTTFLAVLLSWASAAPTFASPQGRAAAAEVSRDNYVELMDDWLYTHDGHNRGYGVHHDLARNNIQSLFTSYGWSVELHPFQYQGSTYYNVVATRLGATTPGHIYIIGAHYDSVNNPGADDNASGVALILEAARVLGPYESDSTIRLIAFDREEQGLIGSTAYAADHAADDIRGMISCDMVAYSPDGEGALLLARYGDGWFIDAVTAALHEYGDIVGHFAGWTNRTDHAPFDSLGFPAMAVAEEYIWSNPNYHSPQDSFDTPGYLNFDFAANMTRGMVGWLVDQAGVTVPADALVFEQPLGLPDNVDPAGGTVISVEVTTMGDAALEPGTVRLHYDVGDGWESTVMQAAGDDLYQAPLPPAACESTVSFHFSAVSDGGDAFTDPFDAPDRHYEAFVVHEILTVWADDFETDQGWSVSGDALGGMWERGVPNFANHGDPPHDYDGSGQCFVTGNGEPNNDVDAGYTFLDSPTFDLGDGDAMLSYAVWFTNNFGANFDVEFMHVYISNDDGVNWHLLETLGQDASPVWEVHTFRISDVIAPTPFMRVRFEASDTNWISHIEAAVDAFQVVRYDCGEGCPGDLNGDGAIGQSDLGILLSSYGQDSGGDIDGDGDTDQADLGALLGVYGQDCP